VIASVTGSITHAVATHGIYAIFVLMTVAAVFPVGSELVMLYAGAVAAGAFANAQLELFGVSFSTGWESYLAVSLAGLAGNLVGASVGWWAGRRGGRALLDRYGRFLHVSSERVDRSERWFARFDTAAVPLGFAAPIVRSFVAIPAGIARMPFVRFIPLAAIGCAVFCFGLAAAGWALGRSYTSAHHDLRYVEYVIVAGIVLVAAYLVWRKIRASKLNRRATDPAR
jgi:membrane protein DedA with SNARE-associated domain